jgi:hypothetical protein
MLLPNGIKLIKLAKKPLPYLKVINKNHRGYILPKTPSQYPTYHS